MNRLSPTLTFLVLAFAGTLLRAEPGAQDNASYHQALLNYKSGKYEAARVAIEAAEKDMPRDVPIELLKVRILGELHDYNGARTILQNLYSRSDLTPAYGEALTLTSGDLFLRQNRFDEAAKAYESFLQAKPNDHDGALKLIYAHIGVGDLAAASKLASDLKPSDPTNPAYYFARAALARATGNNGDEEQAIGQARTIYGITTANRYLKTYYEVFASDKASISSALNPPATTNAAPKTTTP